MLICSLLAQTKPENIYLIANLDNIFGFTKADKPIRFTVYSNRNGQSKRLTSKKASSSEAKKIAPKIQGLIP